MQQLMAGYVVARETPGGTRYMRPTDAKEIPRIERPEDISEGGLIITSDDMKATDWRLAEIH